MSKGDDDNKLMMNRGDSSSSSSQQQRRTSSPDATGTRLTLGGVIGRFTLWHQAPGWYNYCIQSMFYGLDSCMRRLR